MIDLKLSFQKNESNTKLTVTDITNWQESGIVRTQKRLFLFLLNGSVLTSSIANASTLNVTSWESTDPLDGVYKALFVSALPYNILTSYIKNSIVEYNEKLYIAIKEIEAGVEVEGSSCWKEVIDPDIIFDLTSFPNFSYTIGYFFNDDHLNVCVGKKAIAYAKNDCGCTDTCSMIEDLAWTQIYHTAAVYAFGFGDYKDAGKFIEMANSRCGIQSASSPCNCN